MTKQQIMQKIKEENNNPSIKWNVAENTTERIVLTNDYDKGINYSVAVRREVGEEWISVRDNLQDSLVGFLVRGVSKYDDYKETEEGLLKGVAVAIHNFNNTY